MLNKFVKLGLEKPVFSLKDFEKNKNKILIVRNAGGVGDILMHMMMFKDFKRIMPEAKIVFACPSRYHELVRGHPYVDELIESRKIEFKDYINHYDTTSACTRHEIKVSPLADKNRSDIWANHCGVEITDHNMHINISDEMKNFGVEQIKKINKENKPSVVICPISAMKCKNLLKHHMEGLVDFLNKNDLFAFYTHLRPINELDDLKVPGIFGVRLKQWAGVINAADYVIAVDTGAFHLAGGLGKPLTGIFSFADGKVYGKYYDFELVQKHRDNGDWDCGPCYNWENCPKSNSNPKPCITELTIEMITDGVSKMLKKHGKQVLK